MQASPHNARLPLFPLPNVVLFPETRVPLHIFEPRYRQMIADALQAERCVGMIALPPEHLPDLAGNPGLFEIGCAGVISDLERLPDGHFNLVLDATRRFRVLRESPRHESRLYRMADVEWLDERNPQEDAAALARARRTVVAHFCALVRTLGSTDAADLDAEMFEDVDDARLVNALCQLLELPTIEKQSLLEANTVRERATRLASVLEFHLAALTVCAAAGVPHRH